MAQLLTASEEVSQKLVGYRFFVELARDLLELDAWAIPAPVNFKIIDVVVTIPTKEAIALAIAGYEQLKDYSIVNF